MSDDTEVAVRLRGVNVHVATEREELQILHDVELTVRKGSVVALAGESGSGKSTAMLATLDLLASGVRMEGEVEILGRDILALTPKELRRFRASHARVIFQDPWSSLHPMQSIGSQLIESARLAEPKLSKTAAAELAIDMLTQVGIPEPENRMKAYPHQVSGGQLQRIVIAMALVASPQVLLCDEPTTALDVTTQEQILQLLRDLRESLGLTIIIATHDLEVIEGFADELIVMYAGSIVESGPVHAVLDEPRHPYTWALLQADPQRSVGSRLRALEGRPPSPDARPLGCAFAPRCAAAIELCTTIPVRPVRISADRVTACTRVQIQEGKAMHDGRPLQEMTIGVAG
ncbi:ABC transporter ATP-binding protein [Microbacterium sp. A82]|uniref:ABC transporter ATP-binding protein n=1 Tax=Microbacterium sp. A82 TaxID=3450452 RepID=UPI003F2BEFB7